MATILIVEDDRDTLDGLAKLLEIHGYRTMRATNGWEALLALDKLHVDLIVCDLNMPGMTGQTFLKIMHNDRRRQHLPVIVVTALEFDDPMEKARELGVEGWFTKAKYHDDALVRAIRRQLEPRSIAPSNDGHTQRAMN